MNREPPSMDDAPQSSAGRILVMVVVLTLVTGAGLLLFWTLNQRGESTEVALPAIQASGNLSPLEAFVLGRYINQNEERLATPLDPTASSDPFEVEMGQTATGVANQLVQTGIIADAELFINYVRYTGLEGDIEAGVYLLSASMTVPEIAETLSNSSTSQVTLRIPEGWRREQIADWLDEQPDVPFTGIEFLIATESVDNLPADAYTLDYIPPGATLEGYLFPDTYQLRLDATAADLVSRMLLTFDDRVSADLRAQAAVRGLTFHEVLTVASIVEREAAVADERPMIASVYLNRLRDGMLLQADPTVQYAQGFTNGQWWNLNLTQADYTSVDSPYNTYLYNGVPPGPIANPSLSSIEAVLNPAETPFIFFRAACDGSGRHNFAITFDEHLANACQ